MHAREVHAHETPAHQMHARGMHAREVRFDFRKWFCGFGRGTWVGGHVWIGRRSYRTLGYDDYQWGVRCIMAALRILPAEARSIGPAGWAP